MGNVYSLLCLRSAELSKAFGLRNLCYSKISVSDASRVQDCWTLENPSQNKKYAPTKCCILK